MSGHSFGAITSQAMMRTEYLGGKTFTEKRFKAFLLMSPSPVPGKSQPKAFGHVISPVLCMTGTKDSSVIKPGMGYKERVSVYNALPVGNKYLYVFDGGEHKLFSGPNKVNEKLKDEHVLIQKLTLLFWQAHLLDDIKAKKALASFKARGKDIWQKK